ncbi:MAG: cysteine dioxygenase [Prevotellaceae bacterium]|jgi:predicted metal-dependent enzyme (double-stranded beta helix superfamily)|nr:cysteine dioxygenase [Prevotellaceae bacterium]
MNSNIYISGYETFFEEILSILANNKITDELGEAIKKHALSFISVWNSNDFKQTGNTYTRCYIGKDSTSKWEAIVMCWKKGNQTSIHGHPDFASYTFLQGEIAVETFTPQELNSVTKNTERVYKAGESLFAVGKSSHFDNHIHRLTCISDYAYSLHIYSDDARKGKAFSLLKE